MDSKQIIEAIDEEIARLQQVRNLLDGGNEGHGGSASSKYKAVPSPIFGIKRRKKRVLSAEARERIAAAQRKRWAKQKRAAKALHKPRKFARKTAAKNLAAPKAVTSAPS